MSEPCPFCEIVAGRAFAHMVAEWDDVVAFRPLNAVTREHTLVVPVRTCRISRPTRRSPPRRCAALPNSCEGHRATST